MIKKHYLKLALVIPAMAGLCVMAGTPDLSVIAKKKTAVQEVVAENINVDKTLHDFGTIKKEAGSVSAIFTITNNTKVPIILSDVRASCGCTTPEWTREPVEPKKTGKVTATYNPTTTGPFEKTVTINVSSGEKTETFIVKIKGTVE